MVADIFIILGISAGVNMLFFSMAFSIKKDLFTDITYAGTFLVTIVIVMVINNSYKVEHWIVFALILLWSLRLGSFLFIRILKTKVDHRFDKMRNSFIKFGAFWFLQGITVWLVNMPAYIILLDKDQVFNLYQLVPIILAVFFLAFETIADFQKFSWNNNNPGKFIKHGLWKYTRHPNYFGEFSFWWMIMIMALLGNYKDINLLSLIGPLYITFTLYKISGLPLLEKQSWRLFGSLPEYQTYLDKTPTLLPIIGKKGIKEKWKVK